MPAYRVLFCSFPYSNPNNVHLANWLTQTIIECREDKRIGPGNVSAYHIADTPITMSRNRCIKTAMEGNYDFVVMVDDDMHPDLPYAGSKPFWSTTFDFMVNHNGPCAVAAPYNGPPPHENCYAFRWTNKESGHPNADFQIESYSRAECESMRGIQQCAAFPTGICVIDMRAFEKLRKVKMSHADVLAGYKAGVLGMDAALRMLKMEPGYFYYEWTDSTQTDKASTEDVTFSRDLTYAGVPIYINWDAYAGHYKTKCVGRPGAIPMSVVPEWVRQQALETVRQEVGAQPKSLILGETPLPPVNRIESFSVNTTASDHDVKPRKKRVGA